MHTPQFLSGRLLTGQRMSLEPFSNLMRRLGNPQHKIPTVLIGGTNGKGSTQAFLTAILKSAGYRVGSFTSPSLASFSELIVVDGKSLPQERLEAYAEEVLQAAEEGVTLFEAATAMAFLAFQTSVDIAIIEVGMGGRRDATNVAEPIVSIITHVALDHCAELGTTVEEIAREKFGIARAGCPLLTAADNAALNVLEQQAAEHGVPFHVFGKHFWITSSVERLFDSDPHTKFSCVPQDSIPVAGVSLRFKNQVGEISGLEICMQGEHQQSNAALAIQAACALHEKGFTVSDAAVHEGLRSAYIPGRLEWMTTHDRHRILVDGAHNPHAMDTLVRYLATADLPRPRQMVLAIYRDKDLHAILEILEPHIDRLICTRTSSLRCLEPAHIFEQAASFTQARWQLCVANDMSIALAMLLDHPNATNLIAGSLSVVEAVRCVIEARFMNSG